MPCRYAGLLAGGDVNKQIWVSHIQFEISLLVSSGGVTSGWWSCWNGLHTAPELSSNLVFLACLSG